MLNKLEKFLDFIAKGKKSIEVTVSIGYLIFMTIIGLAHYYEVITTNEGVLLIVLTVIAMQSVKKNLYLILKKAEEVKAYNKEKVEEIKQGYASRMK